MPLVFIHGVNTRNTDEDYARTVAARRVMFEELVVPTMVKRGFASFTVADDIYWGDLGVSFAWNLRAVPDTKILQSLGPDAAQVLNLDLIQLVSDTERPSSEVQKLGSDSLLVAAAQKNPAALVRAIFSPEADRFAPRELRPPAADMTKADTEKTAAQGQHLGLMLIAVETLARDAAIDPLLVQANTDDGVLEKIQNGVQLRYQQIAKPRLTARASDTQHLGAFGNAIGWAADHLKGAVTAAKKAAGFAVAESERGASLVALKGLRDSLSRRGLRFLGDVFVYLHHGRTAAPAIYERVKNGVIALDGMKDVANQREPFIIVTHSFGSEILYDLLTSGALDGVTIDLWVTAGAQTSLFAEMQLFRDMKLPIPPDTSKYALGRPVNVKKWINFYDAADVLSYLHEPVFGSAAVTDIPVRAQANLTNAHGHYFVDVGFYERIAAEL